MNFNLKSYPYFIKFIKKYNDFKKIYLINMSGLKFFEIKAEYLKINILQI